MDKTYIVAEEYLDEKGNVSGSTILLDTDSEEDAASFALDHIVTGNRRTQVVISEISCAKLIT